MSCLLNHRPPDCVATVASLFKEETLIVHFFFTLKTSIFDSLLVPWFSEMVVVSVTITVYGPQVSGGCLANIIVLLNFHRVFVNTGFSEEEIWFRRTESFPKVTCLVGVMLSVGLSPCSCSWLQPLCYAVLMAICLSVFNWQCSMI